MEVKVPVGILNEIEAMAPRSKKKRKWLTKLMAIAVLGYESTDASPADYYLHWGAAYIDQVTTNPFYRWFASEMGYLGDIPMTERMLQHDGEFKVRRKTLYYRIRPELLLKGTDVKIVEIDLEASDLNYLFPEVISHYEMSCNALTLKTEVLDEYLDFLISPVLLAVDDLYVIAKDKHDASKSTSESIGQRRFKLVTFEKGAQYFAEKKNLDYIRGIAKRRAANEDIVICDKEVFIGNRTWYLNHKRMTTRFAARKKIEAVSQSQDRFVISGTNGRMSTYLTNLNTAILPFLSIDGMNIESYDMKSSQPTILANILTGNKKFLDSLRASDYVKLKDYIEVVEPYCSKESWEPFLETLVQGDIYKSLGKELGMTRSQAKNLTMIALFRNDTKMTLTHRAINRICPGAGSGIIEVKKALSLAFPDEKSPLSLFLQMTEAHIFIAGILSKLAEKGLHCFSRHDSILFASTPDNIGMVNSVARKHIKSIGFKGDFKLFTYWHNPQHDPWYFENKDFLYDQTEYWEWDRDEAMKERELEKSM